MARKGWDALSESYRSRLMRSGIGQSAYESGSSLHRARGHISQPTEAFSRRAKRFAESHATGSRVHQRGADIVPMETQTLANRIRAMGPAQGQQYMDYRRQMTRLYERGDYEEAQQMYLQRPKGAPGYMYWYHGMFGG